MTIYFCATGILSIIAGFIMLFPDYESKEVSLLPWHLAENSEKLNWFGVTVVTLIHIALVPFLFALHFVIWAIYQFCMLCIKKEYRE